MPVPAVFVPGILMPASLRYAPLFDALDALGDTRPRFTKELEVYARPEPPQGYSIDDEVASLERFADDRGFSRFHLYGHSAGAAISLAFVAAHADRVVSLAVDEPASDFTDDDRAAIDSELPETMDSLPVPERMARFARSLVREGVELPPPPPPSGDPEMAKRPAGLVAFRRALTHHDVDRAAITRYPGPVYYSYGSLSNERWETMAARFDRDFARCTVERYDGIHHLNTSHQSDPARVARALERLWAEGDT